MILRHLLPLSIFSRRKKLKLLVLLVSLSVLQGCSPLTNKATKKYAAETLPSAYDYLLINPQSQAVSLATLAKTLRDSDVVFIGEYHENHASHLLQMQLFSELHQLNKKNGRPMVLSMEMFNRDQQNILNDYLESKIGERYLIEKAPTWKNYKAGYRPLVEYAKQQGIAVTAANAPGDFVRCIGKQGEAYVDTLDATEKSMLAQHPFADIPGYEDKFFGLMSGSEHMPSEQLRNSYLAQIARDNTMAESIAKALKHSQGAQLIHINGSFHSEGHLGTVAALKRLQPKLKIKVITPLHIDKLEEATPDMQDDFYYLVHPQPEEFVSEDYMKETHAKMFAKSGKKAKSCKPSSQN